MAHMELDKELETVSLSGFISLKVVCNFKVTLLFQPEISRGQRSSKPRAARSHGLPKLLSIFR